MTDQWYLTRDGQNYGPYSWSDLVEFSKTGKLDPQDSLWNQANNNWIKAKDIPGLFSEPTLTNATTSYKTSSSTHSNKKILLISLISVAVVVVGLLSFFLSRHYSGSMNLGGIAKKSTQTPLSSQQGGSTDLGTAYFKEPDPALLINSSQWGWAPANQLCIMLEEGKGKKEAESIAEQISGTIVGEVEYIQLYQIEIPSTSAQQLEKSIEQAKGLPNVATAFPNQVITTSKLTIEGKRCSPLNDPMYGGGNDRTYEMIGLQDAWDYIKASGVTLNTARVGVLDSAIYTRSGHDFSPELHLPDKAGKHPAGKVQVSVLNPSDDLTDDLEKNKKGELVSGGLSHSTMVTHVIGADPGSGTVGGAGILGDKLQISVSNLYSGVVASKVQNPDSDDPTQYLGYSIKALVMMKKQIENKVKVINLSFGLEKPEQRNASMNEAYRRFFTRMQQDHPDVVFVAAAGNESGALDGSNYGPGGISLPNVITVGGLNPEGGIYTKTNYATGNGEVTLSANATDVPVGLDPQGRPVLEKGTSLSAPQVTAAIALIQSIRPGMDASVIKGILVQTAHQQVTVKETDSEGNPVERKVDVPQNIGGRVLRVDEAVLRVINDLREEKGLKPLDKEHLKAKSLVKLTATGGPEEFKLTATVAGVDEGGLTLSLDYSGQGIISGSTKRQINSSDSVSWDITLKDKNMFIKVTRSDSNACATINLSSIELEGTWEGFWVMTYSVFLDARSQAEAKEASEECEENLGEAILKTVEEIMKLLLNKEVPMTLIFQKGRDEGTFTGSIHVKLDQVLPKDIIDEEDPSKPMSFQKAFLKDGKLHFSIDQDGMTMDFIGGLDEFGNLEGTFNSRQKEEFDFIAGHWRANKINP